MKKKLKSLVSKIRDSNELKEFTSHEPCAHLSVIPDDRFAGLVNQPLVERVDVFALNGDLSHDLVLGAPFVEEALGVRNKLG